MHMSNFEKFVYQKFYDEVTQQELRDYGPASVDWVSKTRNTLEEFLPNVPSLAAHVIQAVPDVLNSAYLLEDLFIKQRTYLKKGGAPDSLIEEYISTLERNKALVGSLESQQVSAEIQRQVFAWQGFENKIFNNGNSIYPDFIFADRDYSELPFQDRKGKTIQGPCLQGKTSPKPSNVPDGIELKTNRGNRIRVDAHAPHIGLHIAFTWDFNFRQRVEINGAWIAFINESDHRESSRNSKTTTVKYSFGHDKFISVL